MIELSAGKANTKYKIYISKTTLTKKVLNRNIDKDKKILIITDSGIPKKYIKELKKQLINKSVYVHSIDSGEKSKSFRTYQQIINKLIDLEFSRSDLIIAFGGGVVGDISGFCASSFLRGIDYIQIPTTLLAQVDSSVGGKTAINVPQGKNLVGAFYNPRVVLISTVYLKTLSEREYKSGLGEVVKYSLIGNKKLKKLLEEHTEKVINRDDKILIKIIEESIKTKSKIVTKDEKEGGIRAILNFGHTFGHAIEAFNKYKNLSHGAAITLGMIIASKISYYEGHIKNHQLDNIINMIDSLNLDTDYSKYNYSDLIKYVKSDKKISKGKLNLVLINKQLKAFRTSKFDKKSVLRAFS